MYKARLHSGYDPPTKATLITAAPPSGYCRSRRSAAAIAIHKPSLFAFAPTGNQLIINEATHSALTETKEMAGQSAMS
jgi:hypothetical protein